MLKLRNKALWGQWAPLPLRLIIVTCWEGQNPRLQATALAFFAIHRGEIEVLRLDDL